MKRVATIAVVLVFIALAFSSCKSNYDCPAYSQAETEQPVHA
ncbi:hypothetical protein [Alkaliflexus imshenetskii]|nr:hypothetical protein [Alkaliflexus imshenetskii]